MKNKPNLPIAPKHKHSLSVIVPIFKQEKTIADDLTTIDHTLSQTRYDYEIIAIVDGIKIDKSFSIIKRLNIPKLKTYGLKQNHGKGYTVRYGLAKTTGDYLAFIDAGMEIDPNGISMILEHMEWYNADIIVASKRHPASQVNYPFDRKIISLSAQIFAKLFLNIKIKDTQAGLKIFKRKVLEKVLPRLLVKNYAFDLEILSVAHRLGYTRIYEAPVKLRYRITSLTHASGLKTVYRCLIDALAVFYRLRILHYYDNKNKRKWIYDKDLKMRINTGQ